MNSLTTVEMHNLMIQVAKDDRESMQARHPQGDVDAILADFINRVSARIGINYKLWPADLVRKLRDEGGPL